MSVGRRHTVVISDVHLAEEVRNSDDAWLRYRRRQFFPDDDFAALVRFLLERALAPADSLEFVFDGDAIELESLRISEARKFEDFPRNELEAVTTLEHVIRDHRVFFESVALLAAAGHRVVFVAGNHDVHLALPAVSATLQREVAALLPDRIEASQVIVKPWFHQTAGGVHVEHGHQYDAYCSFRDPLRPLDVAGREVQPTVGSLAFRHLIARMGYFNAYDERSFMLSVPRYFAHWARYYLFTRRSLAVTWFAGALRIIAALLRERPKRAVRATLREQAALGRAVYAQTLALDAKALAAHASLFAEPADQDPHRVVREMRLDHAALGVIGAAGLITAAFKPKLGMAIALGALLFGVGQELIAPRERSDAGYRKVDGAARSIAKIYGARAVVFGHTHIPHAETEDGVIYANAGSWAPPLEATHGEEPFKGGRPVVWLRREERDDAPIEGGLYRLVDGDLVPAPPRRPPLVVEPEPEPMVEVEPSAAAGGGEPSPFDPGVKAV